jgi:polysaccharide biosynthesis protein PslA
MHVDNNLAANVRNETEFEEFDFARLGLKLNHPDSDRMLKTFHTGLPVTWEGNAPAAPRWTSSQRTQLVLKRAFDIALASAAIAFLAPLLILVALAIKLESRGPVFFVQKREGLGGLDFDIFKFRSMRVDACDHTGVQQTVSGDPRVTRVGRFIRRTSIDELPQLFNVLLGNMSVVGPRPHVANMLAGGTTYRELVPYYGARFAMRPGITGWAQANGFRGGTEAVDAARGRIDHDIAYVQNYSLWLDIKIVLLTIRREFISGSAD